MRLTPAQVGVHQICGRNLPMRPKDRLVDRIRDGRRLLMSISGVDFGYDLTAWHNHLKETREGGYTWNRTIVLPKIMKDALASEEWQQAVAELGTH